ncbi:MAG: hypothetical protein LUH82_01460 [Clostridiales bacterium]|nr:hypothetical protein [Clostridiales bacterium]
MKLVINEKVMKKCGGGSAEYWFSYKDYTIRNIRDFNTADKPDDVGQIEYFVSLGIIPFITISNEEIMRAFVKSKGSDKLNAVLDKVKSEQFIDTFWKYFNAYPEFKEEGLVEFSRKYIADKIALWCSENNIEYEVKYD